MPSVKYADAYRRVFWYVFRDLADAYPNAANGAVPKEIVGAVLRSIAHVRPAKATNKKKTKAEIAKLRPHTAMHSRVVSKITHSFPT